MIPLRPAKGYHEKKLLGGEAQQFFFIRGRGRPRTRRGRGRPRESYFLASLEAL